MELSWKDYLAFDAITFAVVNAGERDWKQLYFDIGSLVLDDGSKVDLADRGVQALFQALGLEDVTPETTLQTLTDGLRRWNRNHNYEGPGQHDMTAIRAFRDVCEENGWAAVDGLLSTLYSATPSKAFKCLRTTFDPTDPGIDGAQCYSLVLSVKANLSSTSYYDFNDKWRVVGSEPRFVIPHLVNLVNLVNTHYAGVISESVPPQATHTADLAARGMPDKVEVRKNGIIFATVVVWPNPDGQSIDIRWSTTRLLKEDKNLMLALAAIAPEREGRMIRASFLEDELGM